MYVMKCIVNDCQNEGKAKHKASYCTKHYTRVHRYGTPTPDGIRSFNPDRGCSVSECNGKHDSRGFCSKHYAAWRADNSPNTCVLKGCGKGQESKSTGLCSSHSSFIRKSGADIEELISIYDQFDGHCEICKSSSTGWYGPWHTDHDHVTGRIRGLLCHNCNTGLGRFKDDMLVLQAAIKYLGK